MFDCFKYFKFVSCEFDLFNGQCSHLCKLWDTPDSLFTHLFLPRAASLARQVSISGLFDMAAMMKHIAEQYAYPYGFANTKVRRKRLTVFQRPDPPFFLPC